MGIGIAMFDDITDRRNAENALRRIAFEDPLTGLANRRVLQELWEHHAAMGAVTDTMMAVLLIDLDGFKAVNDSLGHDAGDKLLKTVATRLKGCVREGDLVCRIGGDEFAILLPGLHTAWTAEAVCARIGAVLREPIMTDGHEAAVGASVGVSLYPQDGNELQLLIRRADEALYRRKAERKGDGSGFGRLRQAGAQSSNYEPHVMAWKAKARRNDTVCGRNSDTRAPLPSPRDGSTGSCSAFNQTQSRHIVLSRVLLSCNFNRGMEGNSIGNVVAMILK
jgi:diguanylate cyclase (GGDEF)-like protein